MTDDEINIAIVESLGWKLLANNRWTRPCGIYADLPNYTADLNAMHEAEKALNRYQQSVTYSDNLMKIVGYHTFDSAHATARQRAEAFLRTINLWKQ